MGRSRAKDEAFLALLRPLQRPLEVYCRRMLRNRSLTEDVLQSAVTAALVQFAAQEVHDFKPWIFRIVTLEVFNRNRKHETASLGEIPTDLTADESCGLIDREEAFDALLEDPDAALQHFDDVAARALLALPAAERAVLLLHAVAELKYREIHELLSIPLGSVIGYLSRARKRLRLSLADYAAERGLHRRPARGPAAGGDDP